MNIKQVLFEKLAMGRRVKVLFAGGSRQMARNPRSVARAKEVLGLVRKANPGATESQVRRIAKEDYFGARKFWNQ